VDPPTNWHRNAAFAHRRPAMAYCAAPRSPAIGAMVTSIAQLPYASGGGVSCTAAPLQKSSGPAGADGSPGVVEALSH